MVILGLILIAAAAVAGVELALSNQGAVTGEAFNYTMAASPAAFLLAGVVCGVVAMLGLMLMFGSARRARRRRVEVARHRNENDQTASELAAENEQLRAELNDERRRQATMGGVAVPPGVGNVAYGDQVSDAVRSESISDNGRYDPYPAEHGTGRHAADNVDLTNTTDTEAGRSRTV